jgi:hypothetical protein
VNAGPEVKNIVLVHPDGTTAPELDRLREALAGVNRPDLMLD